MHNPIRTLYHEWAELFFRHCNEVARSKYGVDIRLLDYEKDGRLLLSVGENYGGQREWWETEPLPPVNYWDVKDLAFSTAQPKRHKVYAHRYMMRRLKPRTLTNLDSARHMVNFLIKGWEQYKYQAQIPAPDAPDGGA
jgi:hypothetical protein